jgi:hypothetical protein
MKKTPQSFANFLVVVLVMVLLAIVVVILISTVQARFLGL